MTDPVEAHRAARRGEPTGELPAHGPDVCGVCPICVGLRLLGETRPELLAHLTEAARHLAAAARSLVDDPEARDGPGDGPGDGPAADRVTRIDLD